MEDKNNFANLSQLVQVEILAALPMKHVVRLARLGHESLRQNFSLKWVTDRMTDVTFGVIARTYEMGGSVAEAFTRDYILKRLSGKIVIEDHGFKSKLNENTCAELLVKIKGRVHLHLDYGSVSNPRRENQFNNFLQIFRLHTNIFYLTHIIGGNITYSFRSGFYDRVPFDYQYEPRKRLHRVYNKPALLNGRHIVDVIRTVCEPADVDVAVLDRVRMKATENAKDYRNFSRYMGLWHTSWEGPALIAEV